MCKKKIFLGPTVGLGFEPQNFCYPTPQCLGHLFTHLLKDAVKSNRALYVISALFEEGPGILKWNVLTKSLLFVLVAVDKSPETDHSSDSV